MRRMEGQDMKVGVLGATGYAGQELVRLLKRHEEVKDLYLASSSVAGENYESIYPQWSGQKVGLLQDENVPELDVLFCALPHGLTAARTSAFLARNIKVIDLGADFRLNSAQVYEEWYKIKHPAPELLKDAVYGLPELYREQIWGQSLVANPGCYPTATLLALVPLLGNKSSSYPRNRTRTVSGCRATANREFYSSFSSDDAGDAGHGLCCSTGRGPRGGPS